MADVIIIGGALTGGSTAYHLLSRDPALRVVVVEPDPTYDLAASSRSIGGVRVLFSQEENVRMSQYGHAFYGDFAALMAVEGKPAAAVDYRQGGYLFIANDAQQAEDMVMNHALQTALGARVDLLDAAGLAQRVPGLEVSDVVTAVHAPEDGWIDPQRALQGSAARRCPWAPTTGQRGFARLNTMAAWLARWCWIRASGSRPSSSSTRPAPGRGRFVRSSAWTSPSFPCRAWSSISRSRTRPGGCPWCAMGFGTRFRPEGAGFISGITDHALAGSFRFEVDHVWFEERVWPGLARRMPAFETLKVRNAWAGHYAQNQFDGNMILGPWIGGLENFLIATGFSGHGLQHAPAVGRALAELILDRRFVAIDLARFTYQRILDDAPDPELGFRA